jgi:hypothetical protein
MSGGGSPTNGKAPRECRFSLKEYQGFVNELVVTLGAEARTIVKFVGFPDGTFGLNTTLAATGESEMYHIELAGGACPHCLILGTLGDMTRSRLDIDKTVASQAGAKYLSLIRKGTLPELYIMHRDTLRGVGGRIFRRSFSTTWGVDANPVSSQPDRMPFTGNCPHHAYNGR